MSARCEKFSSMHRLPLTLGKIDFKSDFSSFGACVTTFRAHQIRARSSKRTVRLISGVALDECRVPERYPTRAPFRTPEREVDRAAQPFVSLEILESAGCESV